MPGTEQERRCNRTIGSWNLYPAWPLLVETAPLFRAREGIERAAARGGNADAVAVERRGSGVVVISGGSTAAL